VQDDLDSLPESFEDSPQAKILHLCGVFNTEVDAYTTAKSEHTSFFQKLEEEFSILEQNLLATKPNFEVVESNEAKDTGLSGAPPCAEHVRTTGEKPSECKNFL
jgi:hypothetical protein